MGILNRAPAPIDTDRPAAADFVRVLATWAVGAFHIWQQSWYGGAAPAHWLRAGSVGVDLLVMLSAFCLFLPWANAAVRDQPLPRIRPAEFYRRRALRLLPAYYVSLLFSLVLAVARRGWSKALALDLAAHLALTQQLYRPAYLACQLNGVTWTLTVFALFYLVFPLLAPLCAKWPLPTLAALGLVQLGYTCWLLPQYGSGDYSARFNQLPAFSGVLRRALRWLAALTYSFYLWHQMLTVFLKYDLHLPAWAGNTPPNQLGDAAWMHRADLLYWAAALAVSAAAYYLIEKPAANFIATHKTVSQPRM